MEAAVHDYFKKGLAKSTDRVYSSAKRRYWSFCGHYNLVPIPLTETVLCKFAACLGREGLKFQTIKTYLAGIRHSYIEAGFPAPPPGAWPRLQLRESIYLWFHPLGRCLISLWAVLVPFRGGLDPPKHSACALAP